MYDETRYRIMAKKKLGGELRVKGFWWGECKEKRLLWPDASPLMIGERNTGHGYPHSR